MALVAVMCLTSRRYCVLYLLDPGLGTGEWRANFGGNNLSPLVIHPLNSLNKSSQLSYYILSTLITILSTLITHLHNIWRRGGLTSVSIWPMTSCSWRSLRSFGLYFSRSTRCRYVFASSLCHAHLLLTATYFSYLICSPACAYREFSTLYQPQLRVIRGVFADICLTYINRASDALEKVMSGY